MSVPIGSIGTSIANAVEGTKKSTSSGNGEGFADMLKDSIGKVNELQRESNDAVEALVKGQDASLHDTLLAVEKADMSFRMMMQVRNKLLDAYREVMRTPM